MVTAASSGIGLDVAKKLIVKGMAWFRTSGISHNIQAIRTVLWGKGKGVNSGENWGMARLSSAVPRQNDDQRLNQHLASRRPVTLLKVKFQLLSGFWRRTGPRPQDRIFETWCLATSGLPTNRTQPGSAQLGKARAPKHGLVELPEFKQRGAELFAGRLPLHASADCPLNC